MSSELAKTQAGSSFAAYIAPVQQRDLLAELLADKRSENTRRAYARDLKDFFLITTGLQPSPQLVSEFLGLDRFQAIALVLKYKSHLIDRKLTEATVNRRLASLKSLVRFAQKVGQCEWSLEEITGEKLKSYRDTSGVSVESYRKILEQCDRSTLAGKRNYAVFRLLWDNALRRGEVCKLNVADFDPELRTLSVLGKGRGTQAEKIDLSEGTANAIFRWLEAIQNSKKTQPHHPLFIALDNAHYGHRLTGNAIYQLVREAAQAAGISKLLSPHRCRHSAITAALDATGGNVREVQKLSRHSKLETLLIYDDHRQGIQGKISGLLGGLIDEQEMG